jgi:hypothetical protein
MFNAYAIIIGLFIAGGLATALWGASLIRRARIRRDWPATEGLIETSTAAPPESSGADDLLPHIVFSYTVDGKTYRRALEFPAGTMPTPEFAAAYVSKYPAGTRLSVHYDPHEPENATLEPGSGRGDALILGIGIAAVVVGIVLLLI